MSTNRVTRHGPLARAVHWSVAAAVLALLATGFLPVLGVEFNWVPLHWSIGLVLVAATLVHIVSVLIRWKSFRTMLLGARDLVRFGRALSPGAAPPKPGKYTIAQKLMHHAVTLAALVVIVTGLLMMVRVDTPFWERNPYLLDARTWGAVYVAHGFAAMSFVSLVILHIYFAVRPEKGFYLRAMLKGWITREEHAANHDDALWPAGARDPSAPSRETTDA